jgi:hypothetical protein
MKTSPHADRNCLEGSAPGCTAARSLSLGIESLSVGQLNASNGQVRDELEGVCKEAVMAVALKD